MTLKLGIPSKGRMQADAIAWFAKRGVDIRPAKGGREYSGHVEGIKDVTLTLLSAGEIPRELANGRIHFGLTGRDLIEEKLASAAAQVTPIAAPGFAYADLIIAVPDFWVDVETIDDLDAVAAQFRQTHGFRLRIATKYHNLVRRFLTDHDVADYQLVDSQGATEGTVRNLTAEAIADITSTGATLEANSLRILKDGLILKSEAVLYRSNTVSLDARQTAAAERLIAMVEGG